MGHAVLRKPFPVAARFKAWYCDTSRAGTAGSNPQAAWIYVSCEVFYQVLQRSLLRADHSSVGARPSVVRLNGI